MKLCVHSVSPNLKSLSCRVSANKANERMRSWSDCTDFCRRYVWDSHHIAALLSFFREFSLKVPFNMKVFDVLVYDAFNSYLVKTEKRLPCEREKKGWGRCEASRSSVCFKDLLGSRFITSDPSLSDQTASWK